MDATQEISIEVYRERSVAMIQTRLYWGFTVT